MSETDFQRQLAKLRRDKKLLWLGITSFVLVVVWILAGIFTTSRTSSISPELRELAKPFVPRLESRVFDEIMQKRAFDEGELGYFPVYVLDKNNTEGGAVLFDIMNTSPDPEDSGSSEEAVSEQDAESTESAELTQGDQPASASDSADPNTEENVEEVPLEEEPAT